MSTLRQQGYFSFHILVLVEISDLRVSFARQSWYFYPFLPTAELFLINSNMINIKRSLSIIDNLKNSPARDEGLPWMVIFTKKLDGKETGTFFLTPEIDVLGIVIEDGG